VRLLAYINIGLPRMCRRGLPSRDRGISIRDRGVQAHDRGALSRVRGIGLCVRDDSPIVQVKSEKKHLNEIIR